MLHARRDIVAFFVPDHHHPAAAKTRKAAQDRLIVAEISVAGQRHPVVEQPRDIMFEMQAVGMARALSLLQRRQHGIEDWMSVVEGKGGSGRVVMGGLRCSKQKKR